MRSYDILRDLCGTPEHLRDQFLHHWPESGEFRFQGRTKLPWRDDRWEVSFLRILDNTPWGWYRCSRRIVHRREEPQMSQTVKTFVCPKCNGGWEEQTDAQEVPCRYKPKEKGHRGIRPSRNIEGRR
jgi:hypothetical protein